MPAPLAIAGAGAALNVLGGIFGSIFSSADREAADKLAQEALDEILAVGAPPDLAREIFLQKFQQAGLYVPELEQAIDIGVSKVAQIQEDPALREAQMGALGELEARGKVGLTSQDRVAFNEMRNKTLGDAEAGRQSIVQNMNARGMGGSGVELAAQLQGAQAGANEEAAHADRMAAEASSRALQSIRDAASLSGDVRGQDFQVNNARAEAEDAFKQFDATNQIARQQRNIQAKNQATQHNLAEKQRVGDLNTKQANDELLRQRKAEETVYGMKQDRARDVATAKTGMADVKRGNADATAKTWGGIGAGIGQGLSGMNDIMQKDRMTSLAEDEMNLKYGVKKPRF